MKSSFILECINEITQMVLTHENEIESLDRAIGDGDHYINLKRGCLAIQSMQAELESMTSEDIFQRIGIKLLSTVGGASGPLFASFFIDLSKYIKINGHSSYIHISQGFDQGVKAIMHRGKSNLGEKTMLDVLIPVSEKFLALAKSNVEIKLIAEQLSIEAKKGMLSTKNLLPTKGRSASLGDRALGHIDPGAKSCQLMIDVVCKMINKKKDYEKIHK